VLAVDDTELDRIRGGFEIGSGLEVSFGIEQATYINGVLQATTALIVPGLDPALVQARLPAILIQNGTGNGVSMSGMDGLPSGVLTLIQNTLDQQVIQNLTVIDATVTSLSLFREQLLHSSLQLPF
jgi:hypothetical protein